MQTSKQWSLFAHVFEKLNSKKKKMLVISATQCITVLFVCSECTICNAVEKPRSLMRANKLPFNCFAKKLNNNNWATNGTHAVDTIEQIN